MGTRSHKRMPCSKEGMCFNKNDKPMQDCRDGFSAYEDLAVPLSEQLCLRAIREHEPYSRDKYNKRYLDVCFQLDELLSDPYAQKEDVLDARFRSFATQLESMIESKELHEGSNGRYLYHIDARVLHAYLGAFRARVSEGLSGVITDEIVTDTRSRLLEILADFDTGGLYEDIAEQVALKRTEVEIPALVLRANDPDNFLWPSLFREEASAEHDVNHDFYLPITSNEGYARKLPVQIKTNDYRNKSKRGNSGYSSSTAMVIHQEVVNLDKRDVQKVVTTVEPNDEPLHSIDDTPLPYEEYDIEPRQAVVWGAVSNSGEPNQTSEGEFIQYIGGEKRDGLLGALLCESRNDRLSLDERNILNGATHYLIATLRQKKHDLQ